MAAYMCQHCHWNFGNAQERDAHQKVCPAKGSAPKQGRSPSSCPLSAGVVVEDPERIASAVSRSPMGGSQMSEWMPSLDALSRQHDGVESGWVPVVRLDMS